MVTGGLAKGDTRRDFEILFAGLLRSINIERPPALDPNAFKRFNILFVNSAHASESCYGTFQYTRRLLLHMHTLGKGTEIVADYGTARSIHLWLAAMASSELL